MNGPSDRTVYVAKVMALHLVFPPGVKNPKRAAEEILACWPAKHLLRRYRARVVEVVDGTESELIAADCK